MDYSELDGMKKEHLENDRYMPISTQKLALKKKKKEGGMKTSLALLNFALKIWEKETKNLSIPVVEYVLYAFL